MKPKIIAFYLPQFHPTSDNDKWWGKGFTEWTNVGKAKPLFRGHYQPKVPADLGYYDLRIPEIREAQADLAKEAGIYGFCYYHYWFGSGKEQLQLPFDEVVRLRKPNFPFMLCWANESWHKKFWNKDVSGTSKELLIEQTYPGVKDHIDHFYRLLPAFKDHRYIKIKGKLAFMIYKPLNFPSLKDFIQLWNSLAKKEGLNGFYFIGQALFEFEIKKLENFKKFGLNALNIVSLIEAQSRYRKKFPIKQIDFLLKKFNKTLNLIYDYNKIWPFFNHDLFNQSNIIPTLIPNWDHSPRSGKINIVKNSTPILFKRHICDIFETIKNKPYKEENFIVFLKSWNEWGEGNYIEPDLKFGKEYIYVLKKELENFKL